MNPPSEDIKDILESSSINVGTFNASSGWSICISEMPNNPNTCILIKDTGGSGDSNPNYSYEYPTIQVLIRGNKNGYLATYSKAEEVKLALNGLTNETLNSARYIQILCRGDIIPIGKDESERPLFSVNFDIHRTSIN